MRTVFLTTKAELGQRITGLYSLPEEYFLITFLVQSGHIHLRTWITFNQYVKHTLLLLVPAKFNALHVD